MGSSYLCYLVCGCRSLYKLDICSLVLTWVWYIRIQVFFCMSLSLPVWFAESDSDTWIKVMNVHQPFTVHRVPHHCHSEELIMFSAVDLEAIQWRQSNHSNCSILHWSPAIYRFSINCSLHMCIKYYPNKHFLFRHTRADWCTTDYCVFIPLLLAYL